MFCDPAALLHLHVSCTAEPDYRPKLKDGSYQASSSFSNRIQACSIQHGVHCLTASMLWHSHNGKSQAGVRQAVQA